MSRPTYAVGIMAYNEEATIGRVIDALLAQVVRSAELVEIVVVSSACTDRTDDIVRAAAHRDTRVRLICEPVRRGKIAADNIFFATTTADLLVICNADVIPEPDAIERLLAPLASPTVGMTGARVYPRVRTGRDECFFDFGNYLLWEIHHRIALIQPKMGEAVAFKRLIDIIPEDMIADEVFLEATARARGMEVLYVADSHVSAGCPLALGEYFAVRRRNTCAHELLSLRLGHHVATLSAAPIVWALAWMTLDHLRRTYLSRGTSLAAMARSLRRAYWLVGIVAIEVLARIAGKADARLAPQRHVNWRMARTARTSDSARL